MMLSLIVSPNPDETFTVGALDPKGKVRDFFRGYAAQLAQTSLTLKTKKPEV